MTETNKIIEQTERLLAAATQGKLHADEQYHSEDGWSVTVGECLVPDVIAKNMIEEDAQLIAHAPTALRKLIDEVKRLRDELEYEKSRPKYTGFGGPQ